MVNKRIDIAVIGLGYVGLPLAAALESIFKTIGLDSTQRIRELRSGYDRNTEVDTVSLFKCCATWFLKKIFVIGKLQLLLL